jgi:hypothetical protein
METGSAADTTVTHLQSGDRDAVGQFSFTRSDGCTGTFSFVEASETMSMQTGAPGTPGTQAGVFVDYTIFSECGEPSLASGSGFLPMTLAFPGPFAQKLDSFSLSVAVPVFDSVRRVPDTVHVNMTWTGVGPVTEQQGHSLAGAPPDTTLTHSDSVFRNATISGSATLVGFKGGFDLTGGTPGFDTLRADRSLDVTSSRRR